MHSPAFGLIVLFLATGSACGGGGGSTRLVVPSVMPVEVLAASGDDLCSSPLNYCVQLRCSVRNPAPMAQAASVRFYIMQGNGVAYQFIQEVSLQAGEAQTFAHDFTEAKLLRQYSYKCDIM